MKVIDAADTIMGRLASYAAKELLRGEQVVIINAERCVLSGSKDSILRRYSERRERSSVINPLRFGPKYPRTPDGILRRAVRGMVSFKKPSGRRAYRNLRVYVGRPKELGDDLEVISLPEANLKKLRTPRYMTLGELSRQLGAGVEV